MGTRLRNVKKDVSEIITTKTGKKMRSLGGAHMLTDEVIDLLGSYYGKAIRDSVGTDYETMRKAAWATYFHLTSTDDAPTHHFCPRGTDSWCFFNRTLAEGAALVSHKMKSLYLARLPFEKLDLTRSVYRDLTAPDILRRCLKGATQNPNESPFNDLDKMLQSQVFGPLPSTVCNKSNNIRS